jgi:hypothetical protein
MRGGSRGGIKLIVDHDSKIDNATKVFFHDFIVPFAVRFERVVFRQLPLRSTLELEFVNF